MTIAVAASLLLAPVVAPPSDAERQIAVCAWKRAATSSATLLDKAVDEKPDGYDSEGSATVGPLMRIRAACAEVISKAVTGAPFAAAFGETAKLVKALKQTRPRQVGPDLLDLPVLRCEYRFRDAPRGRPASAVIWTYGEDGSRKELSSSWETLGMTMSEADLKGDPAKLFDKFDQVKPVRAATHAEGKAAGKPYQVDLDRGSRTCQRVNPDGSYTDA